MGKNTIDYDTRRVASRGRKSKAGGKKINSDSILYTPGKIREKDRLTQFTFFPCRHSQLHVKCGDKQRLTSNFILITIS